jgi:hypothetical protein
LLRAKSVLAKPAYERLVAESSNRLLDEMELIENAAADTFAQFRSRTQERIEGFWCSDEDSAGVARNRSFGEVSSTTHLCSDVDAR